MTLHVAPTPESLARQAAAFIAAEARRVLADDGSFTLALSGGRTPRRLFRALAAEEVEWGRVHLLQVDERAVEADSPDRNFATIRTELLERIAIPDDQVHPMPAAAGDLAVAARAYGETLRAAAAPGGRIDLVHLGLGEDGHTASLLPGDPALESADDVVVSREYSGHRRLSLSLATICRARRRLWLVEGRAKAAVLRRVLDGDASVPAGRVKREGSVFFVDDEAAALLPAEAAVDTR